MKTLTDLAELHHKVFSLFNYKHDDRNYGVMEDWRSHAEAVNEGREFTDDCDGFAFTMCELMLEQGFDPEKVLFIICEAETGEGHAVAGYQLGDQGTYVGTVPGTTYIAENRYPRIYDWKDRPGYTWNYFMKFSEPGEWYKITN